MVVGTQRTKLRSPTKEVVMSVRIPIYKVRLVRDHIASFPAPVFDEPGAAAEFFQRLIGQADREHIAALFLDGGCRPTGATIVGIGTMNGAKVHAREIFKAAILASANSILLAHNHPLGLPVPSASDLKTTRDLVLVGRQLGIPIKDHVIVSSGGESLSMLAGGFFPTTEEAAQFLRIRGT